LIQRINRAPVTDLKSFNETVSKLKKGDASFLQVQSYDLQTQNPQKRIVQFTVQINQSEVQSPKFKSKSFCDLRLWTFEL
jgi:hypothetical protein